ncbi:ATP-dependent DNA helicase [Mycoplasmopsis felis]|uniref:ATP-dependent DNA helicase n=1 Tax=Mycoplasmopsis felis TaxID=33923 RepID=UPI002AFF63D2|nr:AAA family ATPase [Mycoplasmopsis felis]WQQ08019.1 AAA family ATPase [Mycoplasmopsis felis]
MVNLSKEKISGKFVKLLKGSSSQGWGFLLFETTDKKKKISIYTRKNVPDLYKKYEIEIQQSTTNKNSFVLLSFVPILELVDTDIEIKEHILKIQKIGKITAQKVFDKWGKNFFKMLGSLEVNKNILKEILNEQQIDNSFNYYEHNQETINKILKLSEQESEFYKENIHFFYSNDLIDLYEFLKKKFETESIDFISKYKNINPYLLYIEDNFNLYTVDRFAILLGYDIYSNKRFEAFILKVMVSLEENNSTLFSLKEVYKEFLKTISLDHFEENLNLFQKSLSNLIDKNKVKLINNKITRNITYEKELFISKQLINLSKNKKIVLNSEEEKNLSYLSDEQKNAYYNFINENFLIVSGNPGTGKSNLIKHFYNTLKINNQKPEKDFFILTPTGRASSILSSKNKILTRTIHSFLKIKDDTEEVEIKENYDEVKTIIIDEFSMVNISVFYKLLKTCTNLEKLILVGDKDQLPAIGPGDILNDLINSNLFPIVILKKFYRSSSLEIKKYVDFINNIGDYTNPEYLKNILTYFEELYKKEKINEQTFSFIQSNLLANNTSVLNDYYDLEDNWNEWLGNSLQNKPVNFLLYKEFEWDLLNLFKKSVNKHGIDNTIILCPMYKGEFGINKINNLIQESHNPNGKVVHTSKFNNEKILYKVGDKVIQLVNRYEQGLSNGDIGYIHTSEINENNEIRIKVKFILDNKERIITYSKEEFNSEINLAYAITVHKFQGSETDNVIFILNYNHRFMLSRKLVYTAISRAKKELWIFSKEQNLYSKFLVPRFLEKTEIYTNTQTILKGGL